MTKDKVIKKAALQASVLFVLYGWEWVDRVTGKMYVPGERDIERVYRELVDDIMKRDTSTQEITTGRLAVTRHTEDDFVTIHLHVDIGVFHYEV